MFAAARVSINYGRFTALEIFDAQRVLEVFAAKQISNSFGKFEFLLFFCTLQATIISEMTPSFVLFKPRDR